MAAGFYSPRQIAGAMLRVGATKADFNHFAEWFQEAAMEAEMYVDEYRSKLPSHEILKRSQDVRLLADLAEAFDDKA